MWERTPDLGPFSSFLLSLFFSLSSFHLLLLLSLNTNSNYLLFTNFLPLRENLSSSPNQRYRPRMSSPHDYEAVRKDIAAQLKRPDYDDGSVGPVFVRLAW